MKKTLLVLLISLSTTLPLLSSETYFEPRVFVGTGAIFGTSTLDLSYGGGLRTWVYFDKEPGSTTRYGTCFDLEYNRRGGNGLPLDYIDITAMGVIGQGVFLAGGSYFAFCIDKHGLGDDAGFFDMGGVISFGFQFPGETQRLVLTFNVKAGLLAVYNYNAGIVFGATLGLML